MNLDDLLKDISRKLAGMAYIGNSAYAGVSAAIMHPSTLSKIMASTPNLGDRGLSQNLARRSSRYVTPRLYHPLLRSGWIPVLRNRDWPKNSVGFVTCQTTAKPKE